MPHRHESYFHLHLVSDATGETLMTVGRAAAVQYASVSAIEHVYPLVRSQKQLDRVLAEVEANPGIVLYTLVDHELSDRLTAKCKEYGCPCLSVLEPILSLFQNYLGAASTNRVGAQHMLNAEYFQRIDALNYTMMHDDGQLSENWDEADVLLVGVSRTSKTPTSIYMANRGIKTANCPLVPGIPMPPKLEQLTKPLIVGLFASPERIVQIRENRILSLNAPQDQSSYIDRAAVTEEIAASRRLFSSRGWPIIDVTRRSIEETAAGIMSLLRDHRRQLADRAGLS